MEVTALSAGDGSQLKSVNQEIICSIENAIGGEDDNWLTEKWVGFPGGNGDFQLLPLAFGWKRLAGNHALYFQASGSG